MLAVNKEAIKALNDKIEVEKAKKQAQELAEQTELICSNTAIFFTAKIEIERQPFVCHVCSELLEYRVEKPPIGDSLWYRRDMCACERAQAAQKVEQARIAAQRERAEQIEIMRKRAGLIGKLGKLRLSNLEQLPALKSAIDRAEKSVANPARGFILQGAYGCGKTAIAAGVGNALIDNGVSVEFWPGFDLLEHIRRSYDNSDLCGLPERLSQIPVFIYDDLGNERIATDERGDWAREQLFRIFYWRDIRELSTIITTNYSVEELGKRIGMPTMSRILGMCGRPIEIKSPDYRLRQR